MSVPPLNTAASRRGVAAALAAIAVFAVTQGMSYPLLALILDRRGVGGTVIGLNAAMTPLGMTAAALLVPALAGRLGLMRLAWSCLLAVALLQLLLGALRDAPPASWLPLRFLLGACVTGLLIVSETWINRLAPAGGRGRTMALYAAVLSAGFALGPFLLALIGSRGATPFVLSAALAAVALPILLSVRRILPDDAPHRAGGVLAFLGRAPILVLAVTVAALFDQAMLSLLPLYVLAKGAGETAAAAAVGVLVVGNVVLLRPLGRLADRLPPRVPLAACLGLTALGGLALPAVAAAPLVLWPFLFVWGTLAFAAYPLALTELGDRFPPADLLAGGAAFALAWGAGGVLGSPYAGAAMERLGPDGLPLALAAAFLPAAVLAASVRPRRSEARPAPGDA